MLGSTIYAYWMELTGEVFKCWAFPSCRPSLCTISASLRCHLAGWLAKGCASCPQWALNGLWMGTKFPHVSTWFHIIHDTRQLNLLKHLKDAVSISSEPKSTCTDGLQDEGAFGSEKQSQGHRAQQGAKKSPQQSRGQTCSSVLVSLSAAFATSLELKFGTHGDMDMGAWFKNRAPPNSNDQQFAMLYHHFPHSNWHKLSG